MITPHGGRRIHLIERTEINCRRKDEERRYLMAASQPLRDVATLMIETGMRPEEVCRMERRHVHLNEGYVFNPYGKMKAARRKLPLSRRAADALRRRLANGEGPFVFPTTRGGGDASRHIVKLNASHKGAIARTGLDDFRLYDLRHTFASEDVREKYVGPSVTSCRGGSPPSRHPPFCVTGGGIRKVVDKLSEFHKIYATSFGLSFDWSDN